MGQRAALSHVGVGVIGCGHWGPNHVRVLDSLPGCTVRGVADRDEQALAAAARQHPSIALATPSAAELIARDDVQALVVATPTATHFELARQALAAGKHVLVEKPLSVTSAQARELIEVAATRDVILMVGHVFVFNPGILFLKKELEAGRLGDVCYMDAVRTNLGPIRHDVGAIYDLASHDVSIFNFLLGAEPVAVSARGQAFTPNAEHEDVAFLTLEYANGTLCHSHASWLNPRKVRQLTVVGDKQMAVWDDMQPLEPLRFYDKGVSQKRYATFGEFQLVLRDGDIAIPKVEMFEPLVRQDQHFLACVRGDAELRHSDGRGGLSVVRVLEAAVRSFHEDGRRIVLD